MSVIVYTHLPCDRGQHRDTPADDNLLQPDLTPPWQTLLAVPESRQA